MFKFSDGFGWCVLCLDSDVLKVWMLEYLFYRCCFCRFCLEVCDGEGGGFCC